MSPAATALVGRLRYSQCSNDTVKFKSVRTGLQRERLESTFGFSRRSGSFGSSLALHPAPSPRAHLAERADEHNDKAYRSRPARATLPAMLDRFPTELITLIVDATSTSVWERKALIDSLSSVCTSYRIAMRPLRESIVHVPKAAVIPLLRSWPSARRKAVDTVFVGTDDQAKALEPFSIRDYSRLLSILPKIKHIYLQRVEDQFEWPKKQFCPCRMWFELNSFNPFRRTFYPGRTQIK